MCVGFCRLMYCPCLSSGKSLTSTKWWSLCPTPYISWSATAVWDLHPAKCVCALSPATAHSVLTTTRNPDSLWWTITPAFICPGTSHYSWWTRWDSFTKSVSCINTSPRRTCGWVYFSVFFIFCILLYLIRCLTLIWYIFALLIKCMNFFGCRIDLQTILKKMVSRVESFCPTSNQINVCRNNVLLCSLRAFKCRFFNPEVKWSWQCWKGSWWRQPDESIKGCWWRLSNSQISLRDMRETGSCLLILKVGKPKFLGLSSFNCHNSRNVYV